MDNKKEKVTRTVCWKDYLVELVIGAIILIMFITVFITFMIQGDNAPEWMGNSLSHIMTALLGYLTHSNLSHRRTKNGKR